MLSFDAGSFETNQTGKKVQGELKRFGSRLDHEEGGRIHIVLIYTNDNV